MLAVVEGYSLALCKDVSLKSFKPRIVIRERLAPDRILDAPVDHVAEQGNPPQLHLEFGIGFRCVLDPSGWHMSQETALVPPSALSS